MRLGSGSGLSAGGDALQSMEQEIQKITDALTARGPVFVR